MAPSRVRIPPSPLARRRGRAHPRRGGRAVECGGLENRYPCKRIGGSNPLPSALAEPKPALAAGFRPAAAPIRARQGCGDLVDRRRSVRGGVGAAPEWAVIAAERHREPRIAIVEVREDEHL